MPTTVQIPTATYTAQAKRWQMLEDLCGGTESMIDAGTRWLPREDKEQEAEYRSRLKRSILYPAYADTIDTGVSRMFSRPISLKESESLSERLALIEDDADRAGTSLTQFGRRITHDGMKYGRLHFMVDFPATTATANRKLEQESGVRPYFAAVCPSDIIGWKFRRGPSGKQILAQLRVRESSIEPDGEYGEKAVKSIRVSTHGDEGARWEVWTEAQGGDYAMTESGTYTLGYIPLVTAYYDYVWPFEANPPYEGLAWQNVKHWRSSSEQDNLLRVARVPILTGSGIAREDIDRGITIGASKILASPNPDAKWSYTEHSGAAIGAGQVDIDQIEKRMEALGMAPMTTRSGAITATEKAIDESKSSSDLEAWARVTESALLHGYKIAAEWVGEELHKDFGVDIATRSDMLAVNAADMQELGLARARGDITRKTFIAVMVARGMLPKDLNVEAEADAADANPPLGSLSFGGGATWPPPDRDEDDEDDSKDAA